MYLCSPVTRIEMTSPTKSEPDYDESEDEDSLPRDADSTGSLHELDNKFDRTTSTEDPSDFTEGTQDRLQEPPSPGTSRKRVLDEVYQKSHLPLLSTTPQKTPPKSIAFPYRSPADAQTAKTPFGRPLEHTGLSALRNVMNASSPPASTGGTAVGDETERSLHGVTEQERKPFIHGIQTFEQDLEKEFQQFEQQLEGRDRSAELAALDWNDLERRFTSDLDPLIAQEDQIRQELGQRLQVLAFASGDETTLIRAAIRSVDAGIE